MPSVVVIFVGAGLGALLRWGFSMWLNPVFPAIPLGTLTANLVGGLLIGLASAWFLEHHNLSVLWPQFAIVGFLGGLTTFSSFSGEVVGMLMRQEYGWALGTIGMHLGGSLALTIAGIGLARWLIAHA
ncbi:MAG: fluoride efflux transporter CrcB [Burkholderiaceae bacterium]|jgi:CrcB protein|nr:fluoride efflux transporter CrcB [Burkholderiaceae bacterium]